MYEVEVKFEVDDFESVTSKLEQLEVTGIEESTEADSYFGAPDRDFGQTDEALRMRSVEERNFLTYKGPKTDKETKTRLEIEIELGRGDETRINCRRLLEHLGFRHVLDVVKQRKMLLLREGSFDATVCLDQVKGLGCFVELEILSSPENMEQAKEVLKRLADLFGLTRSQRKSYLEMLLEKN